MYLQEKALKKVGNLSLNGSGVPDLPDDGGDEEDTTLSAAEISRLRKVISKGLVENTHTVEIERKDPTSPLYRNVCVCSVMAIGIRDPPLF